MHRPVLALLFAAVVVIAAPCSGRAQTAATYGAGALGSDPFAQYFGWYLPNQAYQASQPRVEDTINAITVVRQRQAIAARDNVFDTRSRFDIEDDTEFGRAVPRGSRNRGMMTTQTSPFAQNVRGMGPSLYFTRTDRYFPMIRSGHGPNRNIAALRSARGSAGAMGGAVGGGMGIPGGGMPGPR